MRVFAYIAAIPGFLVWALAAAEGYQYALTAFGFESPGCCHGPPSQFEGVLAVVFPLAVLAVFAWMVLSRMVSRRPVLALAAFLVSLPVGLFFAFSAAMEVTPL